jgi:hypothetical protein
MNDDISLEVIPLQDMLDNSIPNIELETRLVSYDMHCKPNMILQFQSELPYYKPTLEVYTTKEISSFIWEYSSKYNIRYRKHKLILDGTTKLNHINERLMTLRILQKMLDNNNNINIDLINRKNTYPELTNGNQPTLLESRIAFLLIFGQKVRLPRISNKEPSLEIIVAGNPQQPCRVKRVHNKSYSNYETGKVRYEGELRYINHMKKNNNIYITLPNPVDGYQWIFNTNKVHIWTELIKSNEEMLTNEILFYVNDIEVEPFNGSILLKPLQYPISRPLKECNITYDYVIRSLYLNCNKNTIIEMNKEYDRYNTTFNNMLRYISNRRLVNNDYLIFDWLSYAKNSIVPNDIWKNIIVKLYNNYNNEIQIGPIDRRGHKMQHSISPKYEGMIMRFINMLSMLYPRVIIPKTELKYKLIKNVPEYNHLIDNLKELTTINNHKDKRRKIPIKIKTKLWNHQKITSDRIFNEITTMNRLGYADSSSVGSGKTLTAITTMSLIYNYNINKKELYHNGFLILLPTTKLYKTWKDEINKHSIGFHIVEQYSNGSLSNKIRKNTILITTLGRMRDHPIIENWQFVVIDECLSVQNKNALQTEEAWRQVMSSQYGVLMMSATFFRSRFDKLFYMIKMLRCGLPENKDYLDTILSESIVCHIPNKTRKWITNINKYNLEPNIQLQYNKLANQDIQSDRLYNILSKFLYDNHNYVNCFESVINKLGNNNRALIYARSKKEADDISNNINTVSRYPDKSKRHVVLSYAEGTYGLNDLVIYNTMITRPYYPDKMKQMMGRLDRPNQKCNVLNMEYILIGNTIEEAWLLRLEMANNFHKNHIMPLAEFYDLAVTITNKY